MRTKRGYMLIKGKKHFVYEGLNIIGRNKAATVIIPDVSVSHYHSSVVIIDDNHYLCDVTSSNGTYLMELKLNPLQLYELNSGKNLKIGTVEALYYKLTNNFDATATNEEDEQLTYEENVFNAKTQVYDIAGMHKPTQSANIQKLSIEEEIGLSNLVSIHDVPTQIFENHDDDGFELKLNQTEESLNLDNTSEITLSSRDDILINDLPTQIVGSPKENEAESERKAILAADISIHSLPTQLICSTKDDHVVSPPKVPDLYQTSDVIEETILNQNNDGDEESSRESTDFLTMQPAATQSFNCDSQSQLFLKQLQRRVRYAISSSDEESCHNSRESSQKKEPTKLPPEKEQDLSDEETDVESSQIKMKKLTKKTVLDSDSDGDSTDVELPTVSDQEKINVSAQEKMNVSSKVDEPDALHVNHDAGAQSENQQVSTLDDSDIIQTTQDCKAPSTTTVEFRGVDKIHQEEKIALDDTNMEASLADSFHLVLTESDDKCDNNVPLVQDNIFVKESDKLETSMVEDLYVDQVKSKLVDDVPHTQLEVIFDDTNLPVEVNSARPSNPLSSILTTAESPKEEESVEDKLAKMFQSQLEPKHSNKDDIFVQPTQLVECTTSIAVKDDVFVVPRQLVATKLLANKSCEKNAIESNIENTPKKNVPEDKISADDNDIFLQPTQIMAPECHKPVITAQKTDHVQTNRKEIEDDDIFLQPTQIVAPECKKPAITAQKTDPVHTTNGKETEDDDIFLQPTQVVVPEYKKPVITAQNTDHVQTTNRKEIEDDDIFLQPTQIVAPEYKKPAITAQKTDPVQITNKNEKENDDIFLLPTQIVCDDKMFSTTSENCTAGDEHKANENRIKPTEDTLKQPIHVAHPKSTKLTCFLNSIHIEASDSETADVDSNLNQSGKTESSNVSAKCTNQETSVNPIKDDNADISKPDVNRRVYTRNAKKPGSNSIKEEEIVLKDKHTNKSSVRLRSRNTDIEDTDVIVYMNDNIGELILENKQESMETVSNIEEISASDARKIPEHKQNKKENESSKKCSNTDTTVTKIIALGVPTIEITTKTLEENDKGEASNSLENESISIKTTRVSTRRRRNQELKGTDHTTSEITALNKTEMPNNAADFGNGQEKSTLTNVDKLQASHATESIVKRNEETPQKSRAKGTKTKQADQNSTPTKKSKVSNLKTNECNMLRRSTRRKSLEEKSEGVKDDFQKKDLDVIKEMNTSLMLSENTNSEDEFVDTNRTIPQTTRHRRMQTITTINKKGKESENENTPLHVNVISTRSKRTSKTGSVSQPEVHDDINSSKAKTLKSNEQTSVEGIDKYNLSPNTNEIDNDTAENKVKRYTRKRNESSLINKDEPSTSASTRSKKPKKKQDEETDQSCNESEPPARTRKPSQQKEELQQNEKKDKPEIMLARRSKKFKSEEKEVAQEKTKEDSVMLARRSKKFKVEEEGNNENELSCSEASTVASSSDTGTPKLRRHRTPSKTSEDDFRVTKVQKERKPTTLLPSPERTKRILKPKVVFTMLDSPQLETIIRSLGGFVVDSIEASTVLVTTTVKRSQKLLSAIGLAKPICSPKWLHDSKSANMFLDPWQYILEDKDAETKWNFSLKESLRRSSNNKLLENYTFQIMANSFQDVLKGSIESCGGKYVSRAPSKDSQINFIIIATPENKNKYNRLLKQNPAPKIVAPEAIFDGVLRQELHLEDHLLS